MLFLVFSSVIFGKLKQISMQEKYYSISKFDQYHSHSRVCSVCSAASNYAISHLWTLALRLQTTIQQRFVFQFCSHLLHVWVTEWFLNFTTFVFFQSCIFSPVTSFSSPAIPTRIFLSVIFLSCNFSYHIYLTLQKLRYGN